MGSTFDLLVYAGVITLFIYQLVSGLLSMKDRQTSLRPFQLFLFLLFLSSELSRSFFPLFAKALTHGPSDKTFGAALPQITWGLSALVATPCGWLVAKKIGQRNVLLASALMTAAALALTAVVDNYWVMLACRAVASAGYGLVNIVAVMYLAERGLSAKSFTGLLAAIAMSAICGNSLGGLLVTWLSYAEVFWLSAASAVLAAGVLHVAMPAGRIELREKKQVATAHLLGNWKIQLFAVLNTMPYRFVLTGFVLYLLPVTLAEHHVPQAVIGQLMMLYFLLNYVLVKPVAEVLDRLANYRTVALVSTAMTGVGLVLYGYSPETLSTSVCALVLIAVGMTLNSSIQIPVVPSALPQECARYGADSLIAYFRTVERVGSVAGPLLTVILFRAWPASAPAVIGWALVITTGLLAAFFAVTTAGTDDSQAVSDGIGSTT
ncbi:hypothetical protein WL29_20685 [Burkholderia ubonensis]|uniref:Major facilitator superfamily (MFS) profile domain-containing protein n=1 Tax=Burkholderia ubonensis TaxID=101571 RepID=A0A106QCY0_9BURK|nr:MFS transporter [Burkholderia ubonensis]KWA83784.1 hypothetical protein WL29_20685 [Burkholderia ubonensis]